MNIELLYSCFKSANGVTTDSRVCPDGSIFFALKGENFDGNKYARSALDKGCRWAVVDDVSVVDSECFILVEDVLAALQQLANYHRKQLALPIIGITGSNGKTTTKELLAAVLKSTFNLHYTQGNFNNHIGVPLTLLQLDEGHEIAIVEMGANHPGEIAELCAIAEPNLGLVTNIGKAHLEGFGGLEGVKNTKKALCDFVRDVNGHVFVNGQDELLMSLSEGIERTLYNTEMSAFSVEVAGVIPTLELSVVCGDTLESIHTHLVGEYNVVNVAAALSVGNYLGVTFAEMKKGLEDYVPTNNRSQILKTDKNTIILDAYNANPASMKVAIDNFKKLEMPNKIVLLGAMKELGRYSEDEHCAVVKNISGDDIVMKAVVGEEFCAIKDEAKVEDVRFFSSIEELKYLLKSTPLREATILIKGSRSMKMETLVEFL